MSDPAVADAVSRAETAYRRWSAEPLAHRAKILAAVAEAFRDPAEDLASLMTLEMGKPITQARGEVQLSASIFAYYAETGPTFLEDEELDIAGEGRAIVRTAAIGPLLGIMPWNFPYYQATRFVAPNLLLGNTVLLKHAPNCPQQALAIEELLLAAGVPAGAFRNVFASNEQVAEIIANPAVRGVSLTGSERAGAAVGELAGRHMKKCVLELGGSDPFVVLADADLDVAVPAAVVGRFGNAGQVCTSSKRLIVDDQVFPAFLDGVVDAAAEWAIGDPREDETRLGPMSSQAARDDLAEQVQDAVDKGAVVHLGAAVPDGPGSYYPATVLSGVTPAMRAYHEELFGPVAVVYRVGSADEAVQLANDSRYGLGGAVFGRDEDQARRVADRIDVGMVGINTTVKSAPDLPFGGVKNSGVGRELGRFGLDEFANKKLIRTT